MRAVYRAALAATVPVTATIAVNFALSGSFEKYVLAALTIASEIYFALLAHRLHSTTLATLAGIVFSIYTSAGYALAGLGVELDAIASVVIGGTLLSGGVGTVLGTLFGVLIQGLIQTWINFDGTLSSWWTKIAIGILLFAFIALQRLLTVMWDRQQNAPVKRLTS